MSPPVSQPKELRRQQKPEAIALILRVAKERSPRPVLVRDVEKKLGSLWSLEETTNLMNELVLEGRLRAATVDEQLKYDIRMGFFYVQMV